MANSPWTPGRIDTASPEDEEQLNAKTRLSEELAKEDYDQTVAEDYYKQKTEGLDQAFYGAARDKAAEYGKRGLSSSGASMQAQSDLAFRQAAQKRAAAQYAIDSAKATRRRQLLDQAHVYTDLEGANSTYNQLSARDRQADQDAVTRLIGIGLSI